MEVVAVFSVCYMLNFFGMYTTTEPVSQAVGVNVADTQLKKSRAALSDNEGHGSMVEEFMALNHSAR